MASSSCALTAELGHSLQRVELDDIASGKPCRLGVIREFRYAVVLYRELATRALTLALRCVAFGAGDVEVRAKAARPTKNPTRKRSRKILASELLPSRSGV